MNKNVKRMFFVTTLLLLLVGLSAISATDASNDTIGTSQQDVVKEVNVEKVSDNTITDTTTKNIKKEEQTTDLYVSDTDGSDENSGTNNSPYKTIQKALDTTNADSIFNIHIAEGTYKGLGNTNLTVNGNYSINFIGSGNDTIIDGEAKYDIDTTEYHWGSSDIWSFYTNNSGNWAMNITRGTGLITISNLTIQKCYSQGVGSADTIAHYPVATINNRATLIVDSVSFIDNCAGVGAGIRNYANSTLEVKNSLFDGNRKSTSTGNFGAAVYNNGTTTITNTTIQNCYARWGSVTNDNILSISNSTFKNNKAYDGASTYKAGSGIYSNTGQSNFFGTYDHDGVFIEVENCTFIDNQQADIVLGKSDAKINNNIFNHSTGIVTQSNNVNVTISQNITNNIFTDIQSSNILSTLSGDADTRWAIYLGSVYYNVLIENNFIDVPTIGESYGIYATGTTIIKNNTLNNYIVLANDNCQVINNSITTQQDYAVTTSRNAVIINNTLISKLLTGDEAIKGNATTENNIPIPTTYVITEENYNEYFDENGVLIKGKIADYNKILLSGNFYNKKFILDNIKCVISDNDTATIYNGSITTRNNTQCDISGIDIVNTANNIDYAILLNSTDNVISNMNIYMNSSNNINAIILAKENNQMKSPINLNLYGDSNITAVTVSADNNIIYARSNLYPLNEYNNNTFISLLIHGNNMINNTKVSQNYFNIRNNGTQYGTLAINTNNTDLYNSGYLYGNEIYGIKIENNTDNFQYHGMIYNATANRTFGFYADGSNAYMNNITTREYRLGYFGLTGNYSRGVYAKNISNFDYNETISSTTDFNIKGKDSVGFELENITNLTIYKIQPTNVTEGTFLLANNIINMEINNITTNATTGIIINNSDNITITKATIYTTNDYPITLTNTNNANISDNYLVQTNGVMGNNAVKSDNENTIIEDNSPIAIEITNDNYNQYFTNEILNDETPNIIITFGSDIYNKNMTFTKTVQIENPKNYTLYNTTLSFINQSTRSKINNIKMNSTDNRTTLIYSNVVILNVTNSTIYHNSQNNLTRTIYADTKASQLLLTYNNITTIGKEIKTENNIPSNIMIYDAYNQEWTRLYPIYNNFNISYSESDGEGTTQLVYNLQARHSYDYNNITINGDNNAVFITNFDRLSYNNIQITSNNEITAIKYNISSNNGIRVLNNNIKLNASKTTTIYVNSMYSKAIQLNYNNIEIENQKASLFNIDRSGMITMSFNNITANNINNNIMNITQTAYLYNNTILISTDNTTQIPAIITPGFVYDNYILTPTVTGDKAIESTGRVYNNTPTGNKDIKTLINIQPLNLTPDTTINLTATVTDQLGNNINTGKVTFKVNGKTVKDTNGKVIYAKVVDGIATVEYVVPDSLAGKEVNITAVYSGSAKYYKESITITKTIAKAIPTLTTEDVTATLGGKITLKATITDNNKVINTGKIVFKINGKTVKDENGKVIYAKVVNNTVELEYTLPESMKAGSYNITATFISADYDRLTDSKTLTVNA